MDTSIERVQGSRPGGDQNSAFSSAAGARYRVAVEWERAHRGNYPTFHQAMTCVLLPMRPDAAVRIPSRDRNARFHFARFPGCCPLRFDRSPGAAPRPRRPRPAEDWQLEVGSDLPRQPLVVEPMITPDSLQRGRVSFAQQAWADAYAQLAAADQEAPLMPQDLEWLATAAYLAGQDIDSERAWVRAHQGYLDAGEVERAARCAFWLAFRLLTRGERARAGGWLARAGRLLDDTRRDCVERGYLLLPGALQSVLGETPPARSPTSATRRNWGRVSATPTSSPSPGTVWVGCCCEQEGSARG
jgi:hypothetical protein